VFALLFIALDKFQTLISGVNLINIFCALFCQYPSAKKLISGTVTREKLHKALLHKKFERKMLMKLIPGVNFINILRTAFALVDPKSVKNTVDSSVSCYAFGIYKRKSCT